MLLALVVRCSQRAAEPQPDVLVGVNYFAGWWEPTPNKWQGPDGVDWRAKYPDRVPLLGEYNLQATMDREIAAAADYGVDFFQILWYAADSEVRDTEHINVAVEQFMNSPHSPPHEVRGGVLQSSPLWHLESRAVERVRGLLGEVHAASVLSAGPGTARVQDPWQRPVPGSVRERRRTSQTIPGRVACRRTHGRTRRTAHRRLAQSARRGLRRNIG